LLVLFNADATMPAIQKGPLQWGAAAQAAGRPSKLAIRSLPGIERIAVANG